MGLFSRNKKKTETVKAVDNELDTEIEASAPEEQFADVESDLADLISLSSDFEDEEDDYRPALTEAEEVQFDRASHDLTRFIEGFDESGSTFDALSGLIAEAKARNGQMQRYAAGLRREAAKSVAVASEFARVNQENNQLNDKLSSLTDKMARVEAELESAEDLKSGMQEELSDVSRRLDKTKEALAIAEKEVKRSKNESDHINSMLDDESKKVEKLAAENQRLNEMKVASEDKLVQSRKELADITSSSAELEIQNQKLSEMQKSMLIKHEKLSEDHKSLRRDYGLMQTRLADFEIKNERLKSENQDITARLASEKFAMTKDHEALKSEVNLLNKRTSEDSHLVNKLQAQLDASEKDRQKIKSSYDDLQKTIALNRKDLSTANLSISELNLKYSADLLTLDQLREENMELRHQIEMLESEKMKLTDFEHQAKNAYSRAEKLEAKLAEYVGDIKTDNRASKNVEKKAEAPKPEPKKAEPAEAKKVDVEMPNELDAGAANENGIVSSSKH